MDGAAHCVDLRGLGLLEKCRTLRRDNAERVQAEARRALLKAEAKARAADDRLAAHRAAWREREAVSLASMAGQTLEGARFRRERDMLNTMADAAVRLQKECDAAHAGVAEANAAAAQARTRFATAQRRLQQSTIIRTRVAEGRTVLAAAVEEQELDDDLSQRFGRRR